MMNKCYGFFLLADFTKLKPCKIRWTDPHPKSLPKIPCDGIPYIIMGTRVLECHHGPGYKKKENVNVSHTQFYATMYVRI